MARSKRGPKPKTASNSRREKSSGVWSDLEPPDELTHGATLEFHRLVEVLGRAGTLEKTDYEMVVSVSRLKDLLDRAWDEMGMEELTSVSTSATNASSVKANPLIAVINSLTIRHRSLMNDLGLTPASSRLTSVAPSTGEIRDPLDEFLNVVG